jgi:hypothetical protein
MRIGDMVQITEQPWNAFAGELVIVLKIDEDGHGFDFVIPESRGHAPTSFITQTLGNFNLEKLGIKVPATKKKLDKKA